VRWKKMEGEDKVASIFRLDREKIISSQISPRMEYISLVLATLMEKTTLWDLKFSILDLKLVLSPQFYQHWWRCSYYNPTASREISSLTSSCAKSSKKAVHHPSWPGGYTSQRAICCVYVAVAPSSTATAFPADHF
jgi:hypothetical protein